jgi:hypothetical protein
MSGLYDEIRAILHAIWMRRWLAMAVAWAIAIVGWLVVSQIPNSYESRARVSVQMQSILPSAVGITTADQQKDVDRVRQTLTSATNLGDPTMSGAARCCAIAMGTRCNSARHVSESSCRNQANAISAWTDVDMHY